jgi:hypothetical protein
MSEIDTTGALTIQRAVTSVADSGLCSTRRASANSTNPEASAISVLSSGPLHKWTPKIHTHSWSSQ